MVDSVQCLGGARQVVPLRVVIKYPIHNLHLPQLAANSIIRQGWNYSAPLFVFNDEAISCLFY